MQGIDENFDPLAVPLEVFIFLKVIQWRNLVLLYQRYVIEN